MIVDLVLFDNLHSTRTLALLLYIIFCCVAHAPGFVVRKLIYLRLETQAFYSWVLPPPNHPAAAHVLLCGHSEFDSETKYNKKTAYLTSCQGSAHVKI